MPGRVASYIGSFTFVFFGALLKFQPLRNVWLWVLPNPGTMPDRQTMEKSSWHGYAIGISGEASGKPVVVRAECKVCSHQLVPCCTIIWKEMHRLMYQGVQSSLLLLAK